MSRGTLIAGNWKMHETVPEAEQLIQALLPRVSSLDGVEIAICPPYTALAPMVDSARGSRVAVFAQYMHEAAQGAFTGEVSAPMLVEQVGTLLEEIARRGVSILLVEQNVVQALELASRAYVLSEGRTVMEGTAATIRDNADVKRHFLGEM